jgi:PPM family protein phosphatase
MRIGDQTGRTDAGRKRRRNEDAYVLDPPLFVVADGMGGAQAGEVASRLAAAAFREFHEADALAPEARVEAIIQEANRRIFERARADAAASGMGTTLTAALVGDERVVIGHVGDSRAYRIRDGSLEQLTQDHSLVADLMRSGRLTQEEADAHPQRSVITRALGTDADVDVDMFSVEVAPGDVFMLCSDGLTTMVGDDRIVDVVARHRDDLERAAKELIADANRSGGDDNVTIVFFEIVEHGAELGETARMPAVAEAEEDTLTEAEEVPVLETVEARRLRVGALVPILIVLAAIAIVVLVLLMTR